MSEKCKNCRREFNSGIWISPQFADEKALLFCSEKCKKEYLKMKLERIKVNYPKFHEKIMQTSKNWKEGVFWKGKDKNER